MAEIGIALQVFGVLTNVVPKIIDLKDAWIDFRRSMESCKHIAESAVKRYTAWSALWYWSDGSRRQLLEDALGADEVDGIKNRVNGFEGTANRVVSLFNIEKDAQDMPEGSKPFKEWLKDCPKEAKRAMRELGRCITGSYTEVKADSKTYVAEWKKYRLDSTSTPSDHAIWYQAR